MTVGTPAPAGPTQVPVAPGPRTDRLAVAAVLTIVTVAIVGWALANAMQPDASDSAATPEAAVVARVPVQAQPLAAVDEGLIERAFVQTESWAAVDEGLVERAFVQTEPWAAVDEGLTRRVPAETEP